MAPEATYKDMSNCLYYTATLSFFTTIVFGSCVVPNVDIIFQFVGAICSNCMAMIFPALFYLTAVKRAQKDVTQETPPRKKCLEYSAKF